MKELKYSFLYTLLLQILCWIIFMLCYECPFIHRSNAETLASIVGIILIVITSIIYVLFNKKIIQKHNLKSTKYNIFLSIFWTLFSILITFVISHLISKDIIHACYNTPDDTWLKCFLNGIEVLVYGFLFILQTLVIIIITLIKKLLIKIFN